MKITILTFPIVYVVRHARAMSNPSEIRIGKIGPREIISKMNSLQGCILEIRTRKIGAAIAQYCVLQVSSTPIPTTEIKGANATIPAPRGELGSSTPIGAREIAL